MEIILIVAVTLYCIYLNIRLKEVEEVAYETNIDNAELELKMYNKMMEIRKD